MIFKDRADAAHQLAKKMEHLRSERPVILAIPRGGVVTGDVIARALGAPLDILVSRKIGAPNNHELAIGAVMHDGSFFPNPDIIDALHVPKQFIDEEVKSELGEISRRLKKFRGNAEYDLKNRTVILVDDGIATGATMFAAMGWVRKQDPRRLIVAIPVGPKETIAKLLQVAEVIVLEAPEFFNAVGEFYEQFEQVEDSEVMVILKAHGHKTS